MASDSDSSMSMNLDDLDDSLLQVTVQETAKLTFKFHELKVQNKTLKATVTVQKGQVLPFTLKTILGKQLIMEDSDVFTFGGAAIHPVKIEKIPDEPVHSSTTVFTLVDGNLVPVIYAEEGSGSGTIPVASGSGTVAVACGNAENDNGETNTENSVDSGSDSDYSKGGEKEKDDDSDSDSSDSSAGPTSNKRQKKTGSAKPKVHKNSARNQPEAREFFHKFTFDFNGSVLKHLSKEARDAIKTSKEIEDPEEFGRVKTAIEKRIVQLMLQSEDIKRVPGISHFNRIKDILAGKYPYMYGKNPETMVDGILVRKFTERGTGGEKGLKSFSKAMQSKFRRSFCKGQAPVPKIEAEGATGDGELKLQKGKLKSSYGITKEKFYPKGNVDLTAFWQDYDVEDHTNTKKMEEFYDKHRVTVQIMISRRKSHFLACVPGFFADPVYCQAHFENLAEGFSLAGAIDRKMFQAFTYLKMVLDVWCQNDEERDRRMEAAKLKGMECNGSLIPEYVCMLRDLTMVWHENFGGFLRYENEQESNSPHILAKKSEPLVFSVRVEQKTVFQNLNLNQALAAFFHLSFIGQLSYPLKGEAFAVWLQRKVAMVDEEGTKAKLDSSETKVTRFENILGKILTGGL